MTLCCTTVSWSQPQPISQSERELSYHWPITGAETMSSFTLGHSSAEQLLLSRCASQVFLVVTTTLVFPLCTGNNQWLVVVSLCGGVAMWLMWPLHSGTNVMSVTCLAHVNTSHYVTQLKVKPMMVAGCRVQMLCAWCPRSAWCSARNRHQMYTFRCPKKVSGDLTSLIPLNQHDRKRNIFE